MCINGNLVLCEYVCVILLCELEVWLAYSQLELTQNGNPQLGRWSTQWFGQALVA